MRLDLAHDIGRETSLIKRFHWTWDIAALDGNAMLVSEFDDVGLGSGGNKRIFLVERLLELWKVVEI